MGIRGKFFSVWNSLRFAGGGGKESYSTFKGELLDRRIIGWSRFVKIFEYFVLDEVVGNVGVFYI